MGVQNGPKFTDVINEQPLIVGPKLNILGFGPLGANMGCCGPGIGIGIGPVNLWRNFKWKHGKTPYCRTKTEHFRFFGPLGLLGGPRGPQYRNRPITF